MCPVTHLAATILCLMLWLQGVFLQEPHTEKLHYLIYVTPEFFQITGVFLGKTPLPLHVPFWVFPVLFIPEYFYTAFNKARFAKMDLVYQVIQITWCLLLSNHCMNFCLGPVKDSNSRSFPSTSKSLVGVWSSSQPNSVSYSACQQRPIHRSFSASCLYNFILALVKINMPHIFSGFKNKSCTVEVILLVSSPYKINFVNS